MGIAVESSITLNMPIRARIPARKYEINTAGPVRAKASPGKIKIPELIIAPVAMLNTPKNPNPFFNFIFNPFTFSIWVHAGSHCNQFKY